MNFGWISEIDVESKASWVDRLFLTFDIDWASDEVVSYLINLLHEYGVKATFFATHVSDILTDLIGDDHFEVGLHPNYNFLLNGDARYGKTIEEVLDYYCDIVPTAKVIRSHSLSQGPLFLNSYLARGFTHESNLYLPVQSNISAKPFQYGFGDITRVPLVFSDDEAINRNWDMSPDEILSSDTLKVVDFHPIHVFLNTKNSSQYMAAKSDMQSFERLSKHRLTNTYGSEVYLRELIEKSMH